MGLRLMLGTFSSRAPMGFVGCVVLRMTLIAFLIVSYMIVYAMRNGIYDHIMGIAQACCARDQ